MAKEYRHLEIERTAKGEQRTELDRDATCTAIRTSMRALYKIAKPTKTAPDVKYTIESVTLSPHRRQALVKLRSSLKIGRRVSIESAGIKTGKAHVIKSHHNVDGLPEHMKLGLVEPLRELFKDEVRRLGVELGLPREMVYRHPFPGPGLGVRILGEVKRECAELLAQADAIFIDALRKWGWYDKTSQAFAVFLPVKSVGVVGDARAYEWVIALRAVETIDFMTAHWAHLPYDFLDEVSRRIINELRGISRVVYDISGKPPATIEWE